MISKSKRVFTMKTRFGRILSLLLVVAMLAQLLPASVFAQESGKAPEEVLLSGETENPAGSTAEVNPNDVVCEIESMRKETSKHFRMEDGSFAAIQYNTAVHYENEEGQWIDIDNTLQPVSTFSGREIYMASNGENVTAFSADLTGGEIFSVYSGEQGLQMGLLHGVPDTLEETASVQAVTGEPDLSGESFRTDAVASISGQNAPSVYALSEPSFIPESLGTTVVYEDVYEGIDLQYDLFGYNVKESIIVKSLRESYTFHFVLQLDGLTPVLQENGSVSLYSEEGKTVYEIPAPYMVDAEGKDSEAVYYTLTEAQDETVILSVTADSGWIAGATLPVVIDPTIVKYVDSVADTSTIFQAGTIVSGYPNICYEGERSLYIGYSNYSNAKYHQVVAHIDVQADIPDNCIITAAELGLNYLTFSNDSAYSYSIIQAHEFELDKASGQTYTQWIDDMTWNIAHPGGNPQTNVGEMVDFVKVSSENNNGRITLDLTKSMRKSRSFNLIFTSDSNENKRIDNVLQEHSYLNYIAIAYLNDVGIESRFTYQTHSAGRAGTAYISDHTQRLTLLNTLISSNSDILPFSLFLTYNSSQHGTYFGQVGTQSSNLHTRDYSKMKIGSGWKLSAQRCVQSVHISGDDANVLYWVYTDEDGTEHYFRNVDGTFRDEEGLGLKLELVSEQNHTNFLMTDEMGNTTYFRDGILTYDKDVYGNGIYYVYNGAAFTAASPDSATDWMPSNTVANQLTSVYRVIKGGKAERLASLHYQPDGFLSAITDEAGRQTTLTTSTVSGITYLTALTFPGGKQAIYYHSNIGLVGIRDMETNLGFRYAYDTDGSVNQYSSVSYTTETNYAIARIVSCWNGDGNRSSYRDWGADLVKESPDDIRLELIFDNNGRTVCQYTTDSEIKKILGSSSLAYTVNEGTSKSNNKILSAASSGLTAVNLLKDGGMEMGGVWSTNECVGNSSAERRDTTDGIVPRHGQYTIALTIDAGASTGSYAMTTHSGISFVKDTPYTLSAYVKVPSTGFAWNTEGALEVVLQGANLPTMKVLETTPAADIENGWQRVQVTFTVGTSGTYRPGFCLQGVTGTVYIDDVQLEQSEAASVYNLVQNGSFEYNSTHWTLESQNALVSDAGSHFGDIALSGTAPFNGLSRAQQIIPMNCSADTTFQLSGWAKGESAPHPSAEQGDSNRFFGLFLQIVYTDLSDEFHSVPFEWSNRDWQCAVGNVVPEKKNKTIKEICVFCAYDNNYGDAYFDNISLRQEPVATYSYNDDGKLTSATQTGNEKDGREYDGVDLVKYTAPNKVVYEYAYNDKHQVQTVTWDGLTSTYGYDTVTGRQLSSKTQAADGTGIYLQSTAIAMASDPNHTASDTNANGETTSYTYNSLKELVTKVTNANGVATGYSYNPDNDRITSTHQSGAVAINYDYEGGRLSSLSRKTFPTIGNSTPIWQQYSFTTNQWGQQTKIAVKGSDNGTTWDAGITLATYEYEANGGNLTTQTFGANSATNDSIHFTYDDLDRLVRETYNDTGDYVLYAYTAEGNIGKITYMNSNDELLGEYTFEYDSLGRLIRSYESNGNGTVQQTEHLYDTYNRLTQQRWHIDGRSYLEQYRYNDPTVAGGSGDGSLKALRTASNQWIYYNYDELERLDTATVKNTSGEELFKTTYAFKNLSGNRTSMQVEYREMKGYFPKNNGAQSVEDLITGYKYVYDPVGNITEIRQSEGNHYLLYAYAYDAQNQLTTEKHYDGNGDGVGNVITTYTYTYDTAGNLRSEAKTVKTPITGNPNATTTTTTTTKTYTYGNSSWKDLLTAVDGVPIVYEGQTYQNGTVSGNVISGNPIHYTNGVKTYTNLTWEHGRQLASLSIGNKTYTYDYDAEGIRTQKVVDGVIHTYVTQNGRVVQESFPYGNTTVIMVFTYDEQGKPFSLRYSYDGGATFSQYYYAINAQGDVEGIFYTRKNTTTGKQEIHWMGHYTYDAWGNILSIVGPDTAEGNPGPTITNPAALMIRNPLRYRGYYYDTETGFYYLQSRYYDPANHRFINADDAEYSTMSAYSTNDTNLFTYCGNSPVARVDDGGEFWHIVIGAAIGAVANGVLTVVGNLLDDDPNTNWNDGLGLSMVTGAITGGFAVSGCGAVVQMVVNGVSTAVEGLPDVISDIKAGENVYATLGEYAFDVGLSVVTSGSAGSKATRNLVKQPVKRTLNELKHNGLRSGIKELGKASKWAWKSSKKLIAKNSWEQAKSFISELVDTTIKNYVI